MGRKLKNLVVFFSILLQVGIVCLFIFSDLSLSKPGCLLIWSALSVVICHCTGDKFLFLY